MCKPKYWHRLAWAVFALVASFSAWAGSLPQTVAAALLKAGISPEGIAIYVQPLDSEVPVLSVNAAQPMNPASTMKLVTTYAGLASLGPGYVWKTGFWTRGDIADGKLQGDLIVRGAGDPFLTLERIWLMQRALREKGVREIYGNLVLDLTSYDLPPMDPGAFDGEPLAAYNAVPSPLVADFNALHVRLVPDAGGVAIRPELPFAGLRLISQLQLTDASCNGWREDVLASRPDPEMRDVIVFEGSYPRACGEKRLPLNLLPPPQNFAHIFRTLWVESGGKFEGNATLGVAPPETPPWLEFESLPLADVIRPLNKYSSNVMTRMLFLTLGQEKFGAPATPGKSLMAMREILNAHKLNFADLVVENGAGLSRNERISAQSMGQLLLAAYASPHFSELESALPIAATDGTLKKRFNGAAFAGHAHLKTGSLKDVRALAGYLLDRNGRRLAVVMFVNHPNARQSSDAQAELLNWLYEGAAGAASCNCPPSTGMRAPGS
jgi:D-alanyl-D-alanine carboxypeptidase/D-alanyl-D-alanine-endopeptidase (penicillin-binding protein 4)